jgi:hypothetical protein
MIPARITPPTVLLVLSIPLYHCQGAAPLSTLSFRPKRSAGTCSFTFGHSEWGVGKLPPGSVSPPTNCRSLRCATPDFLSRLVALANLMRLSLRKAAHAAMSSAVLQEIRVRFGRDDKVEGGGPPWQWWRGMDGVNQRVSPHLSRVCTYRLDREPSFCQSLQTKLVAERVAGMQARLLFWRWLEQQWREVNEVVAPDEPGM